MASEKFIIWDKQLFDNTRVTSNGRFDMATSATQNNPNNFNSLRLVVEHVDGVPEAGNRKHDIGIVVESNNGQTPPAWFPIAYQFEPFRFAEPGDVREILLQANMVNIDVGIDDIIFVAGRPIARVSRQQGKLGSEFRVRIIIQERDFGGSGSFQNVTFNVYGERFNA